MKGFGLSRALVLVIFAFNGYAAEATERQSFAQPLRIAYNDDWRPYSYQARGNQARGILVDVLQEALAVRMGLEVEHYSYPWNRVQRNVQQGTQDAFITVPTAERLAYAVSSRETAFVVEMRAFAASASPRHGALLKLRNLAQFAEFRVCDIYGNGWAKRLYDGNRIKVAWFRNSQIVMEQLQHGNCDLSMGATEVGLQLIRDLGMQEKLQVLPEVFDSMRFTLMINKDSPYVAILPAFDRTIRDMRESGAIERIIQNNRQSRAL